jgi:hypothetical protein
MMMLQTSRRLVNHAAYVIMPAGPKKPIAFLGTNPADQHHFVQMQCKTPAPLAAPQATPN